MNGFKEIRGSKGDELVKKIKTYLDDNKIAYIETGYEFLNIRNEDAGNIKRLHDSAAKFIRYYPDFCIYKDKSVFLEAKNSTGIEKECYEHYINLYEKFNLKILICNKYFMICPIEDIKFELMPLYDIIAKIDVPVINGIWRHPKGLETEQLELYKRAYEGRTSCNTFAYIDFLGTEFKPMNMITDYIKKTLQDIL
jgi:hypothetical protein